MRWSRVIGTGVAVGAALSASIALAQTLPSTAPAESIDASTPKAALKSLAMAMAAGDGDRIRGLIDAGTPAQQKVLAVTSRMAGAIAGLNRAMLDRFGRAAVTPVLGDSAEQLQQSLHNIDDSVEKIDRDHAAVSVAPGMSQGSMSLHKVDGRWKVQLPAQAQSMTDEQATENVAMLSAQVTAIQSVTAELQAGKYTTAADAGTALRSKVASSQMPATEATSQPVP